MEGTITKTKRIYCKPHKDKQYLFVDLSELSADEANAQIKELEAFLLEKPDLSTVVLVDAGGMRFNRQTMSIAHHAMTACARKVIKTALVGIDGLIVIIFEELATITSKNRFSMFSNTQEALDWLIDADALRAELMSRERPA